MGMVLLLSSLRDCLLACLLVVVAVVVDVVLVFVIKMKLKLKLNGHVVVLVVVLVLVVLVLLVVLVVLVVSCSCFSCSYSSCCCRCCCSSYCCCKSPPPETCSIPLVSHALPVPMLSQFFFFGFVLASFFDTFFGVFLERFWHGFGAPKVNKITKILKNHG